MNELALFAGVGGGVLGTQLLGHRLVCAVEWNAFAREVLLRRQEEGYLPPFPIWDDVRTFDGRPWRGKVDVVSGGFPCQPFSTAGNRKADKDERNMWPATVRIVREVRPRYAFLENVRGLLSAQEKRSDAAEGRRYFGTILADLADAGYNAVWTMLGADDVGAPHMRKRVWILAYPNMLPREPEDGGGGAEAAVEGGQEHNPGAWASTWWAGEPGVGGVAHELADRVDEPRAPADYELGGMDVRRSNPFRYTDDVKGVPNWAERIHAIGNGQAALAAARAFQYLRGLVEGTWPLGDDAQDAGGQ